jgi:hypothetical protein
LSLNVPFLVPMRHAWEQLHSLRQVLLMVGQPAPLPAVQQQQQQWQGGPAGVGGTVSGGGSSSSNQWCSFEAAGAAGGAAAAVAQLSGVPVSPAPQQQQQQQDTSAAGGMLRGVFSLQQLERQWQQQVQLGSPTAGRQWDQEGWFDQELQSQDKQQQQQQQHGNQHAGIQGATPGGYGGAGAASGAGHLWVTDGVQQAGNADAAAAGYIPHSQAQQQQQQQQLPGYALEAVQGMVLSCMDRQALLTTPEA